MQNIINGNSELYLQLYFNKKEDILTSIPKNNFEKIINDIKNSNENCKIIIIDTIDIPK